MIPKILPNNISKALYLDCDLIINGNISSLFTIDLNDYASGAVFDGGTDDIRTYNRLKYSSGNGYFNAGVLLMNLEYWRINNVMESLFSFIKEHPERLMFWD